MPPSPSTPAESWTIYVCECGLISEGKDTHYRIGHAERVIQVIPRAPAEQRIEELEGQVAALVPIALAAWRVRRALNLNVSGLVQAPDPAAKNLVDVLNDLNEYLPLSEDGYPWESWLAALRSTEEQEADHA